MTTKQIFSLLLVLALVFSARAEKIDDYLAAQMAQGRIPGVALAISQLVFPSEKTILAALLLYLVTGLLVTALAIPLVAGQRYISGIMWPEPAVVTPGENNSAPSDAIVLFDGKNFDAWKGADKWKVDDDGGFTVKGAIQTKQDFGDCQLHVEWASPKVVKSAGQGRGNNGIGLMGARYEIQVLDSYKNPTYPEGIAASVYGSEKFSAKRPARPALICPAVGSQKTSFFCYGE